MATFTYIGDEAGAFAFGRWFPSAVPVEVPDDDALACRKMRHSHHFAEVFDGVEVMDAVPQPQPKRRGRPPKER